MNEFLPKYDTWLETRNNSISKLEELADNLDTHHKNVNITNITASSVGVAGGVLAATGAVLSFFTAGLAAPLAVVGTSMAISSGVTSIGASLAEYGITKDRCNDAQKVHDDDMKCMEGLEERLNEIDELNESLEAILAVLDEYESDLIAYSEAEDEVEYQEAQITEEDSLGCSASPTYLAMDQSKGVEVGGNASSGVRKRTSKEYVIDKGQYQQLMALKGMHISTGMALKTAQKGSGSSATSVALGAPAAAVGVVAIAVWMSRMSKAGKAAKTAKVAGNLGRIRKVTQLAGTMGKMGKIGSSAGKVTKLSTSMGKLGSVGSKAVKVGGAALSVVGVAFDIWTIVTTAEDMSEGSKSPAGKSLRNRSGELRRHKKNASDRLNSAKKTLKGGVPLAVGIVGLIISSSSKKDPKKGHHVINNGVRRVLPKIIDDFIKKNQGYFRGKSKYADLKEKIDASFKVRNAYEKPILREDDLAIQNKLVVYTPSNETHQEQNAQKFGAAIKELRKDVVDYMTELFEEMSRNNGKMPNKQCNETIEKEVNTMNTPRQEVYVDRQALQWWLNQGGKWANYERVRNHVAEMFDRLKSKEVLDWVSELYKVHEAMN